MPETINIIEPTLTNQTGHCFSFIASFCRSSEGHPLCLWANRNVAITLAEKNVQIRKHFRSKIRRVQSYFLFRKLLNEPGKIFVSTAVFSDLVLMKWAAVKKLPQGKVYLYFHWMNATAKKLAFLARLAKQHPNLVIMGPTATVIDIFREAGFKNAYIVPYPISGLVKSAQAGHDSFTGLLYAGAARQDKGISQVVDLVEHMGRLKLEIPVKLQNSPDHRGKYDAATKSDIERLERIGYPALQLFPETLGADEYAKLFAGAICIQLYNAEDFADRISGVTLDALSAGSPIITTAGTWIARMVQRFDAGLVVDSTEPENILTAIQQIIADYPRYNEHAYRAGLALQQENSAGILFKTVAA
jgi:glycosyltransferase involved in cell wall biosynthesis